MIRPEHKNSALRLGGLPRIMLVRLEPGEEPREFGLAGLPVSVLRVRHPLPACERMRVTRPLVVIVGPTVIERDLALLLRSADETDTAILQLGSSIALDVLAGWLRRAIEVVTASRAKRNEDTLPSSKRDVRDTNSHLNTTPPV